MSVLYAATGDAIARITLEGGAAASAAVGLEGSGACCLAVDPRDPDRVYAGTFDHGLRVSDDGGLSWREPDVGPADERVLALAVSRAADVAYAGTEPSNLYRSDDAGRTWELLPALRELPSEPDWSFPGRPWTHHVRTIALHPADAATLLVGVELGGVMRSTDGGTSWADHNPQAPRDAHEMATHPLLLAAGGSSTRIFAGLLWDAHPGQVLHGRGFRVGLGHATDLHRGQHTILRVGQMREQVERLEHHATSRRTASRFLLPAPSSIPSTTSLPFW